jgi:methylenetetrahydrofolate dehydrogenase (NADP+)/methenyltetrahydrofolate cyclohydrolase
VVLVGDNPASQVYVRNKVKACEDVGFHSVLEKYDATPDRGRAAGAHRGAEQRPQPSTASWCSCPCPSTSTTTRSSKPSRPLKDVDGFHVASAGALMVGEVGFKACTPYGCMKMLESIGMKTCAASTPW